jgi:hypothetical protein
MSISVTDGLTARSASCGGKFSIGRQSGKNLWRRFSFGSQNGTTDRGFASKAVSRSSWRIQRQSDARLPATVPISSFRRAP